MVQAINTALTALLPDGVNRRKPTLREYANEQHRLLEAQSIEMVQLKKEEETKTADVENKPESAEQQNQEGGLSTAPEIVPPSSSSPSPM